MIMASMPPWTAHARPTFDDDKRLRDERPAPQGSVIEIVDARACGGTDTPPSARRRSVPHGTHARARALYLPTGYASGGGGIGVTTFITLVSATSPRSLVSLFMFSSPSSGPSFDMSTPSM